MNTSKKYSIGILGGTFDPPHDGHKFISKYAILKLNLHEVWWVVTYKNPLKHNSSEYFYRFSKVKEFIRCRKIKIIEMDEKKNIYTIDLIFFLKNKFKKFNFVWLMGTDNIQNLHLWRNWKEIFCNIPIAIFDRPSYSFNITKSKALFFFRKARIKNNFSQKITLIKPPIWTFIRGQKNQQSSSNIRSKK